MKNKFYHYFRVLKFIGLITLFSVSLQARDLTVVVTDKSGNPMPLVMVTAKSVEDSPLSGIVAPYQTVFTGPNGTAVLNLPGAGENNIRLRKLGFKDQNNVIAAGKTEIKYTIQIETDKKTLAQNAPANTWLSAIDLGDEDLKKHFKLQCGFCHQQGSPYTRLKRSPEDWEKVIDRMVLYGSRLKTSAQKSLPKLLEAEHARLTNNPSLIKASKPWENHLANVKITEWPIGKASSQLHDMLWANGKLWVGDNLQDNLIEVDTKTNFVKIHKIPKNEGDKLGGNIGGRLNNYPDTNIYVGLHSLEESKKDGHIFMTGSDSTRLVEFAPESGKFTLYDIPDGYYPHTIRIDSLDRVWFTMAVSNQVAMFDRTTKKFKFWDLKPRTLKERFTIFALPLIFKLTEWGVPFNKIPIDAQSHGLPLPYGIEVTPNDHIWFTRLYSDELGHIDPNTETLTMIKTPFISPRRLRADAKGNLWITVFAEGKIAKYDPILKKFTIFDLPTLPKNSDTPYSLIVDRKRDLVWVTGTASDTLMSFDIKTEKWKVFPFPSRRTFTRDVVYDEEGSIYTSNGSFPAWHIGGGKPTAIRITRNK